MLITLLTNLSYYLPEFFVIMTMTLLLFLESTYAKGEKGRFLVYLVAAVGLLISLSLAMANFHELPKVLFHEAVALDQFSTMAKILLISGTLGVVYLGYTTRDFQDQLRSEFLILCTGVLVGAMLVAGSMNFLSLYVGIEILSILSYVLASLKKHDISSQEAGLKYSLYGALSSAVMIFGIAHLYGATGTINFREMATVFTQLDPDKLNLIKICLVLIFVGLGFKISAFPFHMWSPDVYQGAPTPVTAFFAIVPKIAALTALCRITFLLMESNTELFQWWSHMIQIIAALTMTVGNLTALGQSSVKRMLAYSSIGQVGFILMGLVVSGGQGLGASLFYMTLYLFMTLVAFAVVDQVVKTYGSDESMFFKGLVHKHPILSIMMAITLFSLAGLPPFGGFVAKFNILNLVIQQKSYMLAFIAALNSVVALFYYLRLAKMIIVDTSDDQTKLKDLTFIKQLYVCALTLPVIVGGVAWNGFYHTTTILKLISFKN